MGLTAAGGTRELAPYGIQREMLMFARRDEADQPCSHPYLNAFDIFRVTGPLDTGRIARAADRTAALMDVLGGRFRRTGGVDRFVFDSAAPRLRLSVLDGSAADGLRSSGAWEVMRRVAHSCRDLRDDAPAHLVVTATGTGDHLLMPVIDHAYADARTLGLFVRHLAHFYRDPDVEPDPEAIRAASFFAFTERFADRGAERAAARRYWSEALAVAADKRRVPHFPGGRWKARGTRHFTRSASEFWPADLVLAVSDLAKSHQTRLNMLLLAAVNLTVSAWGEGFVPINYLRNGRHEPAATNVCGLLAEHVVTIAPEPNDTGDGLLNHVVAFAVANASTPQYHGLALRELETAYSEENRLVLFNFLPPERRVRFDPDTVAAPDQEAFVALDEYDHSNRFGARVWMIADPGYRLKVIVHCDADILPDPTAMIAALRTVVETVVVKPDTPVTDVLASVRNGWNETERVG